MFDSSFSNDILEIKVNPSGYKYPYLSKKDLLLLEEILSHKVEEKSLRGLIFYNEPKTNFCLGLSPFEMGQMSSQSDLEDFLDLGYRVFDRISALSVPKVAAIHGKCFGFGLELVLAADYRFASVEATFSFENLGGVGTTCFYASRRISQILGLKAACDFVVSCRELGARAGRSKGLLHEIVPDPLLFDYSRQFLGEKKKLASSSAWGVDTSPLIRKVIYKRYKAYIEEKTKGFYPSSFNALKALYLCYEKDLAETKVLESKFFIASLLTWQSRSVLHVLESKNKCLKQTGEILNKKHISVSGSGFYFISFIEIGLLKNFYFYLFVRDESSISLVFKKLHKEFSKRVSRKELSNAEVSQMLGRLIPLDISLSEGKSEPILCFDHTCGLEKKTISVAFFSRASSYPLLDCFISEGCSKEEASFLENLSESLEIPLIFSSKKSFSRELYFLYLLEVFRLHREGNTLQHIKTALLEFGFSFSPFDLLDEIGFETFSFWLEGLKGEDILIRHIRGVWRGQKKIENQPLSESPSFEQRILSYQVAKDHGSGSKRKSEPSDRVNDRCVLILVKASCKMFEEGVLSSFYQGDYACVASCGFPDFWGGPFKYCETVGFGHVRDLFLAYEKSCGKRFELPGLLKERDSFFS